MSKYTAAKSPKFSPWSTKSVLDDLKPMKSQDSLAAAYEAWRSAPGETTTEKLLAELNPTITSALRSYAGDDMRLKTKASIVALNAVKSYDPSKNVKLSTFVFNHLKGLQRISAERANPVHIPEGVLLDKGKLYKKEQELEDKLGRAPTLDELSDSTGLSKRRIEKLRTGSVFTPEAQLLTEKGDMLFTGKSDSNNIWVDYVYFDLDPIDKKIFEWSTGYGGAEKLKKKDIAQRLKISAPAVSLRINKIVSKLEEGYGID